ncbi:phosphomannomutase [Desulfoprunum benzoelyticum]|uniref:Phosphomannomutase n=1 Tax=Desulfoprunum benzoelyticum TaxID=1506996 RepID=A0A840UL23_9BACT|nr:phosphomannomutase [Desulfoprunum benzoelyticum]MBB5347017.1 phosphomannomutase [Desulfoprunum benzoelyticum]MBM9529711.1 phosphomannomutase [Desulfoprunum benzoelyticum]
MDWSPPPCFKAYDIRGRVPAELNPPLAYDIGRAFAAVHQAKKVAVGRDIRLSGQELSRALIAGLTDMGTDVLDLGICGTEEIYHAAFSLEGEGVDGGIIVTASHNPADYNGMKFVTRGARPVTGESGLRQMAEKISRGILPPPTDSKGRYGERSLQAEYVRHLLGTIDSAGLQPLKIVVNSGNGCAGAIIDLLAPQLPFDFVRLHHDPDGTFPHGVPNPLLPECRAETARLVLESGAALGIAWDGDFDRCFFWDEHGTFIEGYYIVGLLALEMLEREAGAKILYDPRLTWNTEELVRAAGGVPVMTRTGHAFIKERMRREDAIYGGEMSAHHYFRDFGYCDSGMIPWLLICSLLSRRRATLSSLVAERMRAYPVSGEINFRVGDPDAVISTVEQRYGHGTIDRTDGLSIAFADFRFNIRKSNTEPLLRLNVETRGDAALLARVLAELRGLIH